MFEKKETISLQIKQKKVLLCYFRWKNKTITDFLSIPIVNDLSNAYTLDKIDQFKYQHIKKKVI